MWRIHPDPVSQVVGDPRELYDQIGGGYGAYRRPDPRIATAIVRALGDADTVLNVGAGSGSYEPTDRAVVAVEPSLAMIRQRGKGSPPVVQVSATHLPFRAGAIAAPLAVLRVHHWPDRENGLAELKRAARRRVVLFTWDPASPGFWLTDEYFPPDGHRSSNLSHHRGPSARARAHRSPSASHPARLHGRLPRRLLATPARLSRRRRARRHVHLHQARHSGARPHAPSPRSRRRHLESRHGHLLSESELDLGYRLVIAPHH